jgi:putative transcriptional regulator
VTVKENLFSELVQSVKEMRAIRRGELRPSRVFEVPEPDAKAIRSRFKLSQAEFASLLGISVGTLRNWEQGLRRPEGPAWVLLHVVELHPDAVREASIPRTLPSGGIRRLRPKRALSGASRARGRRKP